MMNTVWIHRLMDCGLPPSFHCKKNTLGLFRNGMISPKGMFPLKRLTNSLLIHPFWTLTKKVVWQVVLWSKMLPHFFTISPFWGVIAGGFWPVMTEILDSVDMKKSRLFSIGFHDVSCANLMYEKLLLLPHFQKTISRMSLAIFYHQIVFFAAKATGCSQK